MAVLNHVDLMICHGGNGTIYQALAQGVPILGLTSIFEQEWNMNRVEELGLGEYLSSMEPTEQLLEQVKKGIQKKPKKSFAIEIQKLSNERVQKFITAAEFLLSHLRESNSGPSDYESNALAN